MNKQSILQHSRLLCIILLHTFIANISILAQENAGITLNLENVSLEKAMEGIESQSPYLFFNKGVDAAGTKVSISVTNETIGNVCKALFTPIGISYKIEGTYIYISKETSIKISGTVYDTYGYPLIGAAVLLKGTTTGVSTDLDGKFEFELPAGGGKIPFLNSHVSDIGQKNRK